MIWKKAAVEINNRYIQRAHELNITPNFWLGEEYVRFLFLNPQSVSMETNGKVIWIQEEDWAVFPPLPISGGLTDDTEKYCPPLKIWSDFDNFALGEKMDFLDWEYVYHSDEFRNMSGKKWAVFRKNSRKWARNKDDWRYTEDLPRHADIRQLLYKWLDSRKNEEIQDFEAMFHFLFEGSQRMFLFEKDMLMGVNAWDSNGSVLMYRYCLSDPDEAFLNEFLRLLFYLSMPGKIVIDGGSLDNPGLEKFKDKLNPAKKRQVYSYVIR